MRFELASVDIESATNFVNLARFEFESGDAEHGTLLLQKAQRANELPESERAEIQAKLSALLANIAKTGRQA